MHPELGKPSEAASVHQVVEELIGERIEALASWIQELDAQVRATSAAADEQTLKELRKALEAWTKRDPKFEERLTERVDVLADRLATLSSAVNTTAASHASSEGEIAALRRELEQETAKLQTALGRAGASDVSRELAELRRAVADAGRAARGGGGDAGGVREELENLGVRVDMLAKTVATTAAGLAGREGELVSLRRSLDETAGRIEQVAASMPRTSNDAEVARLDAKLAELAQTVQGAAGALAERQRETGSLRASVEEQGTKLAAVAKAVAESTAQLRAQLEEVAGRSDVRAELAGLDVRVTSLAKRLDADDPRYEEVRAAVAAVASDVSSLSAAQARIAELERGASALRAQVDEHAATVAGLRTSSAELEARLAEVAEKDDGASAVAELDERLTALTERIDGGDPRYDEVRGRIEAVASQLATLAATTADLDERERETAALRGRVDEQAESIARLRESTAALEASLRDVAEKDDGGAALAELEERVTALAGRVDTPDPRFQQLRARLDSVSSQLTDALRRGEKDGADVSALRREVEEHGRRFETALAELHAVVAALPAGDSLAELEGKIAPLETRMGELAATIVDTEAGLAVQLGLETSRSERLEHRLRDAESTLTEIAQARDAAAAEAETARSAGELERAWVREQMDALVSAMADTASRADVEPLAADLAKRVEDLGSEQAALTAEIARTRESLLAETERLEAQLAELPAPSAAISPSEDEQLKRLLTAFADRIETMEQERAQLADEAVEAARSQVEQVQPLVEGLRRRVDESDRRLEALGPPEEVASKLNALSARLDALDRHDAVDAELGALAARVEALEERPVPQPAPAPLPGDGRFRVELRALELRMQHAEAAARENREAVLVQLERLASRIEWRLQRLETGEETEPAEAREEPSLGQVVPLRGGAET